MNNKVFKNLTRILVITLAIDSVAALYFAGLINTISTKTGIAYNPLTHFKYFKIKGFPTGWFLFLFGIAFIISILFINYYYNNMVGYDAIGRLFKMSSRNKSHGQSHFEEPQEYSDAAIVQNSEDAFGTILGQLDNNGDRLVNFRMDSQNRLNRNILGVGTSGVGKTFTFTKPYCFQAVKRRESVILTDPDGGLYRDMAGYFEDSGYVVRRLDLNNFHKSDGWDILNTCISEEDADIDAQMLASIIVNNLSSSGDAIYKTGPTSLLKALLLRVYLDNSLPHRDIGQVYKYLQLDGGETALDTLFDLETMPEETEPSRGGYLTFKTGSANLRGNIVTNLSAELQLLGTKTVSDVLSKDDIDLELPGKRPCAYFCIFPDSHDTYKFIIALFFSMLYIKLIKQADNNPSGKLEVPVNFLLDEFASIGIIPDWEKKMATQRKRDIQSVMIVQDLVQLQNNYPTEWKTIKDNCGTFISLGANEDDTATNIAKRIGKTTVISTSENNRRKVMQTPMTADYTNSASEQARDLLSMDEVFKLPPDKNLILFSFHDPVIVKKYPYTLHPEAKKLRPIQVSDIPDFYDIKAREEKREEERIRLEKYYKNRPLLIHDRSYIGCCESFESETMSNNIKKSIAKTLNKTADKIDREKSKGKNSTYENVIATEEEFEIAVNKAVDDDSLDLDLDIDLSAPKDTKTAQMSAKTPQNNINTECNGSSIPPKKS